MRRLMCMTSLPLVSQQWLPAKYILEKRCDQVMDNRVFQRQIGFRKKQWRGTGKEDEIIDFHVVFRTHRV